MTRHVDRCTYPTKHVAAAVARMQAQRRQLYRIWPCMRCRNAWHAAPWDELARCK